MDGKRTWCSGAVLFACLVVCVVYPTRGAAQDLSPATLPPTGTPSLVEGADDPLLQAIKERAQLPRLPSTPSPSESQPHPLRKRPTHRWRAAESMLRSARMLEREADRVQRAGDPDSALALRSIADDLREQVLRLLNLESIPGRR